MGADVFHHGVHPYVAPLFVRSLHRYLSAVCPGSALLRGMDGLPDQMANALSADRVLARMRTHLPLLPDYGADDEHPGGTLASFPAPWVWTDGVITDVFEHWRARINRIGAPILQSYLKQSVTQEMVGEALREVITEDAVTDFLGSPKKIEAFLYSDFFEGLGLSVSDAFWEGLSRKNLKAVHAVVGPLVAQFLRLSGRPELIPGIEDVIVRVAFTETHRADQLRELADWLWEALFTSYDVAIWQLALGWLYKGALAERDHHWITNALAGFVLNTYASRLDAMGGVDSDFNILTVSEAAAYLGIQPSTLHTHITKRKNTPGAVPVKLRKVGRGRGTYVVHVEALDNWAEKHWRPRKKKR